MADILFIKTSSLGDVIHHMPAMTDARRHLPHARFAWVVEEAFAPLARLHPATDQVIPVASRRWRKAKTDRETWSEVGAFLEILRERQYAAVIDTQGLFRTGLIARASRGPRHGYDSASIREKAASLFYNVKHSVSRELHAVTRNRMLTAQALGYQIEGEPDYGLTRAAPGDGKPYAVLLHATARASKEWPEAHWVALGQTISAQGFEAVLPWGNDRERERSERLAASIPGARIPARQSLDKVAEMIGGAQFVAGVDTGLLHLAAALAVPLVSIFTGSVPALTGPVGTGPLSVIGANGETPSVDEALASLHKIGALRG